MAFAREMFGDSDRAAAIVAAACLEDKLTSAINAHPRQDREALNGLFKSTGALGRLEKKVIIDHLMGLCTKKRKCIAIFAEIGSKFAH